jgi:hypothetical protein
MNIPPCEDASPPVSDDVFKQVKFSTAVNINNDAPTSPRNMSPLRTTELTMNLDQQKSAVGQAAGIRAIVHCFPRNWGMQEGYQSGANSVNDAQVHHRSHKKE